MGYERYPRARSQDDWNRSDARYGRDEDARGRILNRSFSGTY